MDKSLKIFIIVVILLAILATVLLSVFLKKPKESFSNWDKDKSFKGSRYDELESAQEYCFKKFPHQWEHTDRQNCITEFLNNGNNNFVSCSDQKHNLKNCYITCNTNIRAPIKPERSGYLHDEDFYNALNEWEQLLVPAYKIAKSKCVKECNGGVDGECKKRWCEDSKGCNSMNEKQDKMNCKKSCEDF